MTLSFKRLHFQSHTNTLHMNDTPLNPIFNIVLIHPQIPNNTGNVGRTAVVTGCRLHVVRPIAFDMDEQAVRRAGLDYCICWTCASTKVGTSLCGASNQKMCGCTHRTPRARIGKRPCNAAITCSLAMKPAARPMTFTSGWRKHLARTTYCDFPCATIPLAAA